MRAAVNITMGLLPPVTTANPVPLEELSVAATEQTRAQITATKVNRVWVFIVDRGGERLARRNRRIWLVIVGRGRRWLLWRWGEGRVLGLGEREAGFRKRGLRD